MPDNGNGQASKQNNAVSTSSNASADNIEDVMCCLKIHDNQEGVDGHSKHYPDRPGEPDCIYYLRTGLCGYGSNCRFNHPTYTGQGSQYRGELPERDGQPDCQYFLKTGTCKYGATCKYHHPRDRHGVGQPPLNALGLPIRQEEKSCPYYMRTGACKFGKACKFHHPQPSTLGSVSYGSTSLSVAPPSGVHSIGGLPAWSLPGPPYMAGAHMQGLSAYMPVVIPSSHAIIPAQQGWSTYMNTASPVSSTDALEPSQIFNSKPYVQSGSSAQVLFPERPEQPECQYYMKTGSCKYGASCKYHHPKERITATNMCTIGPHSLPLRPGQAVCMFYTMYGTCRYGSACKYDHPMAGYYTVPYLSFSDQAVHFPYQRNSQVILTSSGTSSKTAKFQDGLTKQEAAANEAQNVDTNVPEDSCQQITLSQAAPSPEPQQDQSN